MLALPDDVLRAIAGHADEDALAATCHTWLHIVRDGPRQGRRRRTRFVRDAWLRWPARLYCATWARLGVDLAVHVVLFAVVMYAALWVLVARTTGHMYLAALCTLLPYFSCVIACGTAPQPGKDATMACTLLFAVSLILVVVLTPLSKTEKVQLVLIGVSGYTIGAIVARLLGAACWSVALLCRARRMRGVHAAVHTEEHATRARWCVCAPFPAVMV